MFVCPRDVARLLISRCPPPTFQMLSVLLYKVRPATETFRFPRATFVVDKALHSGLFVLHHRYGVFPRVATFLFDNNTHTCYL